MLALSTVPSLQLPRKLPLPMASFRSTSQPEFIKNTSPSVRKITYLTMVGDGTNNRTIIIGNRSNADGWRTYRTENIRQMSQTVDWMGFVGVNITFRNTTQKEKHQVMAVRNSANMSVFYNCSFEGYQDTLYAHSITQFYRECDIYGTVDFIYWNTASVFWSCNVYACEPMSGQFNVITEHSRKMYNEKTGFSIHNCTIRAVEIDIPWKDMAASVITVRMESYMDGIIDRAGWHMWDNDKEGALNSLYYAEYMNLGPGSNTAHRVTWKGCHVFDDSSIAANFTVSVGGFLAAPHRHPLNRSLN